MDRRPIPQRESGWARRGANALARVGLTPNAISLLSIVVSAGAAAALLGAARADGVAALLLFLLGGALMEVRLLCNLFDGMLAVELGMKSASGVIYNDLPDRISDAVIFAGMGYAALAGPWAEGLGWLAAILAVGTAYVRLLGGAAGEAQDFGGPLAKQARMHVAVAGSAVAGVLALMDNDHGPALIAALAVIAVGSALTMVRRTAVLARKLESR